MAGYGPAPAERRRRRNADTYADVQVTVSADATAAAPPLPNADKYLDATRDWYETWAASPQAAVFVGTDWQRLHMLAPLVDQYFRLPDSKLLAEIRLNESLLGATHVDRLRARIKVEPKSAAADRADAGNVTDLTRARRRRLMSDAS